jgi:hypothetical protein
LNSGLTSDASRLQVNLEIALSGVSAKVKPPRPVFHASPECVETSGDVIKEFLRDSRYGVKRLVMAKKFMTVRFFVLIGVAAFVVCGVAVYCTHRAAHGRTAEERAAYEIGEKAGEQPPRDAKLPTEAELNMIAQKYFEQHGSGDELRNTSPAGGLQARKEAFEKGYRDGFKKTHPDQ